MFTIQSIDTIQKNPSLYINPVATNFIMIFITNDLIFSALVIVEIMHVVIPGT